MKIRPGLLPLSVALLLAILPAARGAVGLQNGDFEQETQTDALGNGSTGVTGWTTQVGNASNANVYEFQPGGGEYWVPNPQSGNFCVQLDGSAMPQDPNFLAEGQPGSPRTAIYQTFTLAVGTYNLSFWINNEVNESNGGGTSGALVELAGVASGGLNLAEFTVTNPAGVSTANSTWMNYTSVFSVTDSTAPITLAFGDDNNPNLANYQTSSDIAIDNVQINVVPEPGPLGVLLSGGVLWGVLSGAKRFLRGRRGAMAGATA